MTEPSIDGITIVSKNEKEEEMNENKESEKNQPKKTLKLKRFFTKELESPFDSVDWTTSRVTINDLDGKTIFDHEVEHPVTWDEMAVRICADKYFKTHNLENHPSGGERSIRDVIHRVAFSIALRGYQMDYLDSSSRDVLYDEICHIMIYQYAAFNSPVFFNWGLYDVYEFAGNSKAERWAIKGREGQVNKQRYEYENPQGSACKSGDTWINTDRGPMYLKDLVKSFNNGYTDINVATSKGFSRVIAAKHNGIKSTYKVIFRDGNELRITKDDEIFTRLNKNKEDFRIVGNLSNIELKNSISIQAKSKIYDSYQLLSEKSNSYCDDNYLRICKSAICGWIQTDGFYGKSGTSYCLDLLTTKEEKKSIMTFLREIYPKNKFHIKTRPRDIQDMEMGLESNRIYGSFLRDIWEGEYGLKKLEVGVPDRVKFGTKEEVVAYLRSAFQAEGSITKKRNFCRISWGVVNKQLAYDIFHMLRNLGIFSRIRKSIDKRENRRDGWMIDIQNYSEVKKFKDFIGFIGKTKQEKLEKYINSNGKTKNTKNFWSSIKSIEYYKEEDVYDIETESHDFYANGILVHNCFIAEVDDELTNGETGIYDWINLEMRIFANGSGCGLNVSRIRGEGEYITGGGKSSGLMSFLRPSDASAGVIKSGGKTRRAAKMLILDDNHPDLLEFVNWKKEEEFKARSLILNGYMQNYTHPESAYKTVQAQNANNSISITDDFMNAVINDEDWELKYVLNGKTKVKQKARNIFNQMVEAAWECGDPGMFYIDTINKWNTIPNTGKIRSSNPCITGETLIATADGRNTVPIKQLAEEGKDVPVYCQDDDGKTKIRMMRNPRLTGNNKKILKVTFDDGLTVRCTENHKFITKDGIKIEAQNLKHGDSISSMTKKKRKINEIFKHMSATKSQDYMWIDVGQSGYLKSDHRMIAEFFNKGKISHKEVVHHRDGNGLNNSPDNLQVIDKKEHVLIHSKEMLGNKNPMRDRWWNATTEEEKNKYKQKMSNSTSGEKNGRYIKVSNDEIYEYAKELVKTLKRSFTIEEWREYAAKNNIPVGFSSFRKNEIGNVTDLSRKAAKELSLPMIPKNAQKAHFFTENIANYYNALESGYEKVEIEDETYYPIVSKKCECCGNVFPVRWNDRERGFCSISCSSKKAWESNKEQYKKEIQIRNEKKHKVIREDQINAFNDVKLALNRIPQKKEWVLECKNKNISAEIARSSSPFRKYKDLKEAAANYNHRVVSIEPDGYEDVYNGTVDEFHSFFVGGHEKKESEKRTTQSFVRISQCGEFLQPDNSSCNLASINLVRLLKDDKTFDIDSFAAITEYYITAMEIIVGGSSYPSKKIAEMTRNTRPLGLGYCNMGGLLLKLGYPYDSDQARMIISTITSLESALAYRQSSKIASVVGPFLDYGKNKNEFGKIIKKHVEANSELKPRFKLVKQLHQAAIEVWNEAEKSIQRYGVRNSQVVVIAPTGTIMFLMGTTNNGIEPPFALTSYKLMSDGSMVVLMCDEARDALKDLGYDSSQVKDITEYMNKQGHVEGAPYLNVQHYPIFDTANVNGNGTRFIRPMAHVEAIAAATPFISGGISKTINMPESATLEEIYDCYVEGWKMGCKSLALYRSGSKWSQPLNSRNKNLRKEAIKREAKRARQRIEKSDFHRENPNDIWEYRKGLASRKRAGGRAPSERLNFQIGGENVHIHPVRYPDNGISELWIEVGKENPTVNGLVDAIGRIVSVAIQYGVPIEALANTMANLQFDPAGFLGPNDLGIHSAKSITDLTAKVLVALTAEYEGNEPQNLIEYNKQSINENPSSISSSEEAKIKGFSGSQCGECGSWKTEGSIKCGVCIECGSTYGSCS